MWLLVNTQPRKIEENKRESSNIGIEADTLIISKFPSTSFSRQVKARVGGSTFRVNNVQ